MNNTDLVRVERLSDRLWSATLNSPSDRNALSGNMRQALLDVLRTAGSEGVTAMIIRGDDKAFCSGYKLDPGVMRPKSLTEDRARLVQVTQFLRDYRDQPVVTIAEVRGHCVAGGTDLMLASDIAVVADNASIAVPNVRGVGISMFLPLWSWMIGPQRAKLLALTGDAITGAEASELGLAAASFDESELGKRVLSIAERIALVPQPLTEVTKHALNASWDAAGLSTAVTRAAELDAIVHATAPVIDFWDNVEERGLKHALTERDGRFAGDRMLDLIRHDSI